VTYSRSGVGQAFQPAGAGDFPVASSAPGRTDFAEKIMSRCACLNILWCLELFASPRGSHSVADTRPTMGGGCVADQPQHSVCNRRIHGPFGLHTSVRHSLDIRHLVISDFPLTIGLSLS
jgi:hypothetical protein